MKGKIVLALSAIILVIILILMDIRINPFATLESSSNLEIELPEVYNEIRSGEEIWFTIKLLSLEDLGRRDITLKYEILDENKNIIATKSETVAVETQASFVNSLQIPENTPIGSYKLKTILIDNSQETDETEVSFSIVEKPNEKNTIPLILISIIVLAIIIYLATKSRTIIERMKIKSKIHKIVNQRAKQL